MSEKNIASAKAYYQAMSNKDLSGVEKYLHPNVQFIAPLAEKAGKEAVLNSVKQFMNFFNTLTIRAVFGSEDQAMLAYDLDFPAPIGISRSVALMTFKDGLIARIELFYDARPFEKK